MFPSGHLIHNGPQADSLGSAFLFHVWPAESGSRSLSLCPPVPLPVHKPSISILLERVYIDS